MLAVTQVNVHTDGQQRDDNDVQQIIDAEEIRKPAVRQQVGADDVGAGFIGDLQEVFDELNRDVVHHQGEKRLIGAPLRLAEGRNDPPDDAGQNGCGDHDQDQCPVRHLAAEGEHAVGGCQTAHQRLTLGAGVPEAHPESGRHGEGNAEQDGDVVDGDKRPAFAERAVQNRGEQGKRVVARQDF